MPLPGPALPFRMLSFCFDPPEGGTLGDAPLTSLHTGPSALQKCSGSPLWCVVRGFLLPLLFDSRHLLHMGLGAGGGGLKGKSPQRVLLSTLYFLVIGFFFSFFCFCIAKKIK